MNPKYLEILEENAAAAEQLKLHGEAEFTNLSGLLQAMEFFEPYYESGREEMFTTILRLYSHYDNWLAKNMQDAD